MRRRFNFKGLKFKIWSYFVLFSAVIMLVLWLLQIVFVRTFYQTMKINEIKKIGDTIISEYGKSDLQSTIFKLSYNNGISVQIIDQNGNTEITSNMFGDMRPPHTDPQTFSNLIDEISQSKDGKVTNIISDERLKGQILVYGALLSGNSSNKTYLYISSQIAPIDATTSILQTQLIIVTILSLLLSLIISLLIASKLSKPIIKITQTAKDLAKGDYHVTFEAGNYTEINQLAEALNYATEELSKTDELRKELIANISHDLRTPLTMVKMYAELIRDVSGDKPEKRDAHTKVIIEEADRLSALITDILDLSKLQAGTAEIIFCLLHQRGAVGKKKNIGHITAAAEHIHQTRGCPRFSRTGSHHKQAFAVPLTDIVAYGTDGFFLVVAVSDFIVNFNFIQVFALITPVHEFLQIFPAENAADSALRVALIVPKIGLKTVGGEHHWPASILLFQTVGVELCLLFADIRFFARALGLNHCERQAIFTIQNIISKAGMAVHTRHTGDFHFFAHIVAKCPAKKL